MTLRGLMPRITKGKQRRSIEDDPEKEVDIERNGSDVSDKESEISSDGFQQAPAPSRTQQEQGTTPPPDGSLDGWLQVVSGFCLYFNSWGLISAFGIFQLFYSNDLLRTETNSNISWIGTMQGFLLAFGSIFAGCILDRGHPRRLVIFGGFFVVLGLMMTSLCEVYWQVFLAQGVCIGVGAGSLFIVAVAILPGWFAKKRAIATGLAATGSSLGGCIYPIIFLRLQPKIGFGWTLRLMGLIALATCSISLAAVKMRSRPPPRPKIVDFTGFKEILFTLFAIVSFVGAMGLYVPFFYIVEFARDKGGISGELSSYMLPIISAGSVVGRTIPALLADRYGCLKVLTFTTTASAILAFAWTAVTGEVGIIVWSLLYGAFSGAFVSLQTPTVAAITPDMRFVGGRMGMNNFCLALGVLVGNPTAGAIGGNFHEENQWLGLQVFTGACLTVSAVLTAVTWAVKSRADRSSSSKC